MMIIIVVVLWGNDGDCWCAATGGPRILIATFVVIITRHFLGGGTRRTATG